ncbi:LysR family transcriptional regulator [Billgrantia aerodenitrificans]|uniref:LysR family transcriptional regulator n=1 Tax=Billgrantia aerodenitrificans TaxID=2733483 RepID=A0ABS9AMD2_9GAMM|nr:LysR family transcriptional regulator [Halomonas aerodenitrificans]MCE8022904.1 LysR family transcriptional regulator [Halomonas aerodenitrificans]
MDRFHLMTVFLAVAEEESFAGAARRLGLSPPAVTRAVAELEERLGVRLLTRTTRVVRVTEAGASYLDDCRRILQDVKEADESAAGLAAMPRGQLNVTAPVLFGRLFVLPTLLDYLAEYPEVNANAVFLDRVVNLVDEGFDVAVRIGELPDSTLRAVRVGQVRRVVCGAPSYFERHGWPQHPDDLGQHRIVMASGISLQPEWTFFSKTGEKGASYRLKPRLVINVNDGAAQAAAAGWGVTRLLSYQVTPQLERGELVTVLEDFEAPPLPVHIVHREGRRPAAKVRAFIDLLAGRLREEAVLR